MVSLPKSISVGDCRTCCGFLVQTFVLLETGSLPLCTCVRESRFRTTCICTEIKSIIIVKVFSVSCVSFKEKFSVYYG